MAKKYRLWYIVNKGKKTWTGLTEAFTKVSGDVGEFITINEDIHQFSPHHIDHNATEYIAENLCPDLEPHQYAISNDEEDSFSLCTAISRGLNYLGYLQAKEIRTRGFLFYMTHMDTIEKVAYDMGLPSGCPFDSLKRLSTPTGMFSLAISRNSNT